MDVFRRTKFFLKELLIPAQKGISFVHKDRQKRILQWKEDRMGSLNNNNNNNNNNNKQVCIE